MDIVTARATIGERRRITPSQVQPDDYFPFMGGLNQVTSPLALKPGQALVCQNYEPYYNGGYRRVDGFERLDGRTRPSEAMYSMVNFDAGTLANYPNVGDTVNGQTSSATGVLLALVRRNHHPNSENLSLWSANAGITVTANATDDPLGNATADKLVETAVDEDHVAGHDFALVAGGFIYSVHLQAAERSVVALRLLTSAGVPMVDSYVDLATGRCTRRSRGTLRVTAVDRGNGWWRVWVPFTLAAADTVRTRVYALMAKGTAATPFDYEGDGTSGLYVWGVMLEPQTQTDDEGAPVVTDYVTSSGGESGSVILARISGTFQNNENLRKSSTVFAVENGIALVAGAPDAEHWDYVALAHDDQRALIQTVPGEDAVLGAIQYGAHAYAFRNHTGGATAKMWRSTATGWEEVDLCRKLRFTDGAVEVKEGDVLVGNTSGATATVMRVGTRDGTWGGSPAASGYFIFTAVTGLYQDGETVRVGSTDVAVAEDADFAQTLEPDGHYDFRINNFIGHTRGIRLYGTSGTDFAFEYDDDDEVFVQIETGMVTDKPSHLACHKNHLFLSFPGGSLQLSSTGLPLQWEVITGAAELGMGDEIVGLMEEVNDLLFVIARSITKYLTGASLADFDLKNFAVETGGFEWTLQRIGQGILLDDRGFTSLATTDRFGNYVGNSFSFLVEKLVNGLKLSAVASVISRRLNLYRCFFSTGEMISIGVSGTKINGIMPGKLPVVVHAATSSEDDTGREVILLAGEDGYVYEMDPALPALSFDGEDIEAMVRLVFHHSKSPSRVKFYRRAQIDAQTQTPVELTVTVDYSYAGPNSESQPGEVVRFDGGGGFWDFSTWEGFKWDEGPIASIVLDLAGSGTNIGLLFYGKSAKEGSHVLSGATISKSMRRINRGATP